MPTSDARLPSVTNGVLREARPHLLPTGISLASRRTERAVIRIDRRDMLRLVSLGKLRVKSRRCTGMLTSRSNSGQDFKRPDTRDDVTTLYATVVVTTGLHGHCMVGHLSGSPVVERVKLEGRLCNASAFIRNHCAARHCDWLFRLLVSAFTSNRLKTPAFIISRDDDRHSYIRVNTRIKRNRGCKFTFMSFNKICNFRYPHNTYRPIKFIL